MTAVEADQNLVAMASKFDSQLLWALEKEKQKKVGPYTKLWPLSLINIYSFHPPVVTFATSQQQVHAHSQLSKGIVGIVGNQQNCVHLCVNAPTYYSL